jgi:hypothetical protein
VGGRGFAGSVGGAEGGGEWPWEGARFARLRGGMGGVRGD